jgi:aryl-alcohol dehydrogenase-like predicted oxidoreductase
MDYKFLGNTGVKVSSLCFGTMTFGGDADEETSAAMFNRCRKTGINFFDCANVYNGGRAEEILGKLMIGCRDELVITSKFFGITGPDVNARGAHRLHIRQAVEQSLARLGTDHIDVYFIHHFDSNTPLEETLRGMDNLLRDGKILYPAVSNFAAWQVEKALGIANLHGWAPIQVIQPMYNLVKRQAEVEILPMAEAEHLAVVPYNPLGGGLLTGKYGVNKRPQTGRLIENPMYSKRYGDNWVYDVADAFSNFSRERGFDPVSLAIAWVSSHPAITAPILGARNVEQLEGSLKSLDINMTPTLRKEISSLSPEPPLATDRSETKL